MKKSIRGTSWVLPNGYWRACNIKGQQCSFKLQVEATRFAKKYIALVEEKEVTLQAVRTQGEADDMAKHAKGMEGVVGTEVRPLENGQFQVILFIKKNY